MNDNEGLHEAKVYSTTRHERISDPPCIDRKVWWWVDDGCIEPMGPFVSRDEALTNLSMCRKAAAPEEEHIITKDDLRRMREMRYRRFHRHPDGSRPAMWCGPAGVGEYICVDSDSPIPPVSIQMAAHSGSYERVERHYPTAREALDDLPRLRKIMDELREGAWAP